MTKLRDTLYCHSLDCGRGSMVELELPKLVTRVRFPSPAPKKRTAMVNRHCRFSFVGLKLKRRNRTDEVEFRRSDAKKWIFQFVG